MADTGAMGVVLEEFDVLWYNFFDDKSGQQGCQVLSQIAISCPAPPPAR
jgi:hypothetical protein